MLLLSVQFSHFYTIARDLEDALSPAMGGGDIYRREGKVYLREYPMLLDAAWFAYGILFPFIVMFSTAGLAGWEFAKLPYPLVHILFDMSMAISLICFFFLYRVQPALSSRWNKWRSHQMKKVSMQTNATVQNSKGDKQPKS